jgi:hypothetical protein
LIKKLEKQMGGIEEETLKMKTLTTEKETVFRKIKMPIGAYLNSSI